MHKQLTPLEALEQIKEKFFKKEGGSISGDFGLYRRLEIVETALKDYEKQHQIDIDLLGTAYKANVQNEKKLKALEIIKETPIFAWYITIYKDAYEMVADAKGFRTNESVEELQEKFDLLKEVLK